MITSVEKDVLSFLLLLLVYSLQYSIGLIVFAHPDNNVFGCSLVTPLHIVPEWYFLCQYAMLKSIPCKNAGFISLVSSILLLFFAFSSGWSLVTFILSIYWYLMSIGAQCPCSVTISFGRVHTINYFQAVVFLIPG